MAAIAESLAVTLQCEVGMMGSMARVWARIVSVALAALLALAIGGVVAAHARTVGEIVDDVRITGEVIGRLTAESPSNFVKIEVKSESGIVTLSGTVDSVEKRSRAAQIASAVSGVKGLVNNIQVAGAGSPPDTGSSSVGSGTVDATGTVASVDASSGTITLSDGRVLRANDRTAVYQPTTVQALRPGDRVFVRGAAPVTVRAPETRMGTVARVGATSQQLVLTDGTIVRVPASANVHRGPEHLTLAQIEPGAELVIELAPVPSASPGTTSASTRRASETLGTLDATDVNVVWSPSTNSR
jgi:hyperosmotically inducible protein